uniref:Uncharacterized protein n=1 Tax=Nymphaea colorata TaxID=210225 RepID=A0A5K1E9T5_9MAGN
MGNFVNEIVFPFSEDVGTSQTRKCSVVRRVFLPMLDDLSNNSLCFLADLVTRKSVKFEKTRPRLVSVIKKYLPLIFENPSSFEDAARLQTQIMEVFRDPKRFKNHIRFISKSSTSCVRDVDVILERLEDLSLHALDAMRRKLCMWPCSLYTEPCTNRNKKQLIGMLRKKIDSLLGDGLPDNLARALRVASLSMKLMNGHFDSTLPEFFEVPHEIEALQNEILKAIWSVPNLPLDEVKELQLLLELDANSNIHFMRTKIKNFLIECLFQCDELEIPEPILRGISTINSYSTESTTREKIEDELICMLNMSSCLKQLVWDLSEHPNIDQEFWGAYKDESETDGDSSNDDDDFDDDHIDDKEKHCSNYEEVDILVGNVSFEATHMEKQEDVSAAMRKSSITSTLPNGKRLCKGEKILRVISDKSLPEEDLHVLQERCHFMPMDEPCLPKKPEYLFPTLSELAKPSITDSDLSALQDVSGNEYLIIQGVCDEVSLFAHKFIGCLLEKLLKVEGNHLDSASRSYLLGGTSVPEKRKGIFFALPISFTW